MSLGANLLREVVKKPLAMGADELILLEDTVFTDADSQMTASSLALAIKKVGGIDLVLCGREASDTNAGQTGAGIAEILGIPVVTLARKIDVEDSKLRVERVTSTGYEVIEVLLPAVITVSNEIGEPRYPTIKGIMAAKKKEPIVWKPADIGIGDIPSGQMVRLARLYQPAHEGKCEFIEGESLEEMGVNLALRLGQPRFFKIRLTCF
jgi:electron transfer flavoprotein beta subunit